MQDIERVMLIYIVQKETAKGNKNMKIIGRYIVVSIITVFLFIGFGYITHVAMGSPFPAICFSGGEVNSYVGIGYSVDEFYPLMKVGETSDSNHSQFSFNLITFIQGVLLFIAIQGIITAINCKLRRSKKISD